MSTRRSVKKNALLNVLRQTSKIVLPFITFPYAVRVLQADGYGMVSWSASVVSYFLLIAALGINDYAIREGASVRDNKEKLCKFVNQIFTINFISTIFSYLLFGIFIYISHFTKELILLLCIQSLNIVFTSIGVEWIFSIFEDYLYITIRSILIQVISIILVFLFVKEKEDFILYAFIIVVSNVVGFCINYYYSKKYIKIRFTKNFDLSLHIKPILYLFVNTALISIYMNSDITMLGVIKGNRQVGLYEVSVKIYSMIKTLINAIVVVTIPRLVYYLSNDNKDKYMKLANETIKSVLVILCPAMTGLYMISDDVVSIVAGEKYLESVVSLKILCFAALFSLIAAFFVSAVLIPHKCEKLIWKITLGGAVINIVLNILFIPMWGKNGAAFTTMIAELVVAVLGYMCSRKYFELKIQSKLVVCMLIGTIGIIIVCNIINVLNLTTVIDIATKFIVSAVVYGLTMLLCKDDFLILKN